MKRNKYKTRATEAKQERPRQNKKGQDGHIQNMPKQDRMIHNEKKKRNHTRKTSRIKQERKGRNKRERDTSRNNGTKRDNLERRETDKPEKIKRKTS